MSIPIKLIAMIIQDSNFIDTFFLLLRSGLYGTPIPEPHLPEEIDWRMIIGLAEKHCVLGTIIESIPMLPERLRPSDSTIAKMNKYAIGLIQTNMILDRTVAHLVKALREHDINGVLLKGQGIARVYRKAELRQSGDIDFYVGKRAYKYARKICKQYLIKDMSTYMENPQHFVFMLDGVRIEIHRIASRIYSPRYSRKFQKWIVEQLEHSSVCRTVTLDDTPVAIPPLDFDTIFIFHHAWRHYIMGGVGLRQLCDWAMIFHNYADEMDRPRLIENIQRFGMTTGWKIFACIAVKYLGVPEEKMPLYDPSLSKKSDKLFEEIISGGNFGYYSNAGLRVKKDKTSVVYGLGKLRNITEYFLSLFPLLPVEATCLYVSRLYEGTIAWIKRPRRK